MPDLNKKANKIINHVHQTGETALPLKHGKPVAEIRPLANPSAIESTFNYLNQLEPVAVDEPIASVPRHNSVEGLETVAVTDS